MPLITGCGNGVIYHRYYRFIRVVGFPCALGKKFTLGLHVDNWPAVPNAQFQYVPYDRRLRARRWVGKVEVRCKLMYGCGRAKPLADNHFTLGLRGRYTTIGHEWRQGLRHPAQIYNYL
jgi:hypothetical protein